MKYNEDLIIYRSEIENEILKQGGTVDDFKFITDAILINGFNNKRSAEDVAWAILV